MHEVGLFLVLAKYTYFRTTKTEHHALDSLHTYQSEELKDKLVSMIDTGEIKDEEKLATYREKLAEVLDQLEVLLERDRINSILLDNRNQ